MNREYITWLAEFCREPLLIEPKSLDDLMAGRRMPRDERAKYFGERLTAVLGEMQAIDAQAMRRSDGVLMSGQVAVVPVFGVIDQRPSWDADVSTDQLGATMESLVADKQVRKIVMLHDSPGGSVAGVPELGERIREMREHKAIVGFAYGISASASYWLMAQASETAVTPSGMVGSVGVISMHVDAGKMFEDMGIKVSFITSSPFKSEGHMFGPLSEEALGDRQTKVNHYHGAFVQALSKGRGVTQHAVETKFGQGRMLTAENAKAAGMVDRISTFSDLLRRLGAGSAGARAEDETPAIVAEQPKGLPLGAKLAAARARAVNVS